MWTFRRLSVAGVLVALLATACSGTSNAAGNTYGTIRPGVLSVAIEPYAPYTSMKGNGMVGLDADVLNAVAKKLHLSVSVKVTDFAGMLAGVQARRYDITLGGVAWTADRQRAGLFTDPPYYSPPAMAVRSGKTYRTVDDLRGLRLGTVQGYVWVKSIQQVPGAKLHVYPNVNGVLDDLKAGRIDVGFLDPLIILAAQRSRPDLKIRTEYLTPPTAAQVAAHPAYSYFQPYMTGFYLPKQESRLARAISARIRAMYADGEMTVLVRKYGADPAQFLRPSASMAASRRGVDRPATWTPPSIRGSGR